MKRMLTDQKVKAFVREKLLMKDREYKIAVISRNPIDAIVVKILHWRWHKGTKLDQSLT